METQGDSPAEVDSLTAKPTVYQSILETKKEFYITKGRKKEREGNSRERGKEEEKELGVACGHQSSYKALKNI